jgi:hypothetical protein
MTDFTRLTVVGTAHKAELVVPDDEAIGALIPPLMELLDEPTGPVARPLALVRTSGEQLDAARSAAEQDLVDGEQLRLVRADDAPPPPEVADVTDVVGDTYADRPGRWSVASRQTAGAISLGAASCVGLLAVSPSPTTAIGIVVAATAVAVLLGRLGRRWPAIALTAVATGAAPAAAPLLLSVAAVPSGPAAWLVVTAAIVWAVLGFTVGAGLQLRPAVSGSVVGVGLALVPMLLAAWGLGTDEILAVSAVAAAVVCGLLPWYALSASGLTGLDDQVLAGRPSRRRHVLQTVDEAYRTMSWSVLAVALPLGLTATMLVRSADPWAVVLGLSVTVLTALRTRAFPLTMQQLPLCLAAVTATLVAVLARQPLLGTSGVALVLIGFGVLVSVAVGARPAEHQRARLRRIGNLIEAVLVIALIPLVLGVFGVYADLLGAFR